MTSGGDGAPDDIIVLGEVVGVHGVRGEIKVYSATRPRENIFDYSPWRLEGSAESQLRALIRGRRQGKGLVAQLEGIDDREAALSLRGSQIGVLRSQLPALDDEEYYWADLQGMQVMTRQGVNLGIVTGLMETGANDVMVVRGDRERLIPYVPDQYVVSVDATAGVLEVDWDPEF